MGGQRVFKVLAFTPPRDWRIVRNMKKQSFWNVDLVVVFKLWWSDINTFLMTLLMFVFLSLPVVIPALIMWFLVAIKWSPGP